MALTFIPELWYPTIQSSLKKSLVYAGPGVVNRNYEGTIRQQGDTVRIRSISRPSISNYTKNSTLTYEVLSDAQRALLIDQAKSFSFSVDDIDRVQGPGGELEEALVEASYGLRDAADQYVAGLYTAAISANQLGTVAITSADLAFTMLVNLMVKLDEANVPTEGRYVVVPSWLHGLIVSDDRFTDNSKSGTTDTLRNGQVGRALGFDILVSNNAPLVTGDDYAVLAGVPQALSYADQIVEMETLRLQATFGTGVRGLHVYGAKVVRPDAIATCIASKT
jgi:hypothetical protein